MCDRGNVLREGLGNGTHCCNQPWRQCSVCTHAEHVRALIAISGACVHMCFPYLTSVLCKQTVCDNLELKSLLTLNSLYSHEQF